MYQTAVMTRTHRLRYAIHASAVILMGALRALALAGFLMFVLLLSVGGMLLIGLVAGIILGILAEILEERARGQASEKSVMVTIRSLEGGLIGFAVGSIIAGNNTWWLGAGLAAAVVGALVGLLVEGTFHPGTARGVRLALTRLVRVAFKSAVAAVGVGTLFAVLLLMQYSAQIPWVNVVPTSGTGLLGIIAATATSFIATAALMLIMLGVALLIGAFLGAVSGLVVGAFLEFSSRPAS